MAKILLVEDDNNLREIYEARLQAEGYDIVTAKDGEEALVVAKKEQPDLIIADVMMPHVSGFEMLDILRNTEGLKDVHVIMLTALGQAEDKTRADSLGADRYLVKSQVTLEDIVKSASDVLAGVPANATTQVAAAGAPTATQPTPAASPPTAVAPEPAAAPATAPSQPSTNAPETPAAGAPIAPVAPAPPEPTNTSIPVVAPPEPAPTSGQPTTVQGGTNPSPAVGAAPTQGNPQTTQSDDQLVAEAVKDLAAGAAQPAQPISNTAPTIQPPAATAQPTSAATASTPAPTTAPALPTTNASAAMPPAQTATPTTANTQTASQARPVLMPPSAQPIMQDVMPPRPAAQSSPTATSQPTPAPSNTPAASAPPAPTATAPANDSITIANKKTISPLPQDSNSQLPPDLNTLLAKEGITQMEDNTHSATGYGNPPDSGHPPGHVITPANSGQNQSPADPSSISL